MLYAKSYSPKLKPLRLCAMLICMILVLPISVIGGSQGGLPIDIMPSDLLVAMISLTFLLLTSAYSRNEILIPVIAVFVIYCFILACLSVISTSEIVPIFSFVKFCKLYLAFFAGYALAYWCGRDLVLRALSDIAVLFLFLFAVSQFLYHAHFLPRLGARFFEFEVAGFPNSSSSYIVILLLVALTKHRSIGMTSLLILISATFAAGSLSRAALVLMGLAIISFFFTSIKTLLQFVAVAIFSATVMLVFDLHTLLGLDGLFEGIMQRYESSVARQDFSNGRFALFSNTLDLVSSRPIFGFMFESYSEYSDHGTPHNQYLEVLFKTGIIGIICYLVIIYIGFTRILSPKIDLPNDLLVRSIVTMLSLVMVGNLTQPNLSYSVTGNLVFFILGLFAIMPQSASRKTNSQKVLFKGARDCASYYLD